MLAPDAELSTRHGRSFVKGCAQISERRLRLQHGTATDNSARL